MPLSPHHSPRFLYSQNEEVGGFGADEDMLSTKEDLDNTILRETIVRLFPDLVPIIFHETLIGLRIPATGDIIAFDAAAMLEAGFGAAFILDTDFGTILNGFGRSINRINAKVSEIKKLHNQHFRMVNEAINIPKPETANESFDSEYNALIFCLKFLHVFGPQTPADFRILNLSNHTTSHHTSSILTRVLAQLDFRIETFPPTIISSTDITSSKQALPNANFHDPRWTRSLVGRFDMIIFVDSWHLVAGTGDRKSQKLRVSTFLLQLGELVSSRGYLFFSVILNWDLALTRSVLSKAGFDLFHFDNGLVVARAV